MQSRDITIEYIRGRQAHGAKPGYTSSACHVIGRSLAGLLPESCMVSYGYCKDVGRAGTHLSYSGWRAWLNVHVHVGGDEGHSFYETRLTVTDKPGSLQSL